jgi:hypothetical protein
MILQLVFLLLLVIATANGKCPEPENPTYSKECYEATAPPPFVCKNLKPDDWVQAALDSYPRCCEGDLTACKCPVKDWTFFKARIGDYCARVEICKQPPSDDSAGPGDTSGGAPFLRGVERVSQ